MERAGAGTPFNDLDSQSSIVTPGAIELYLPVIANAGSLDSTSAIEIMCSAIGDFLRELRYKGHSLPPLSIYLCSDGDRILAASLGRGSVNVHSIV